MSSTSYLIATHADASYRMKLKKKKSRVNEIGFTFINLLQLVTLCIDGDV